MRTPLGPLRALVTVVALTAGAVAATVAAAAPAAVAQSASAQSASAQPASVNVSPATWAHTDSRRPLQSVVDPAGPLPVGMWRDQQGRQHNSKAYFTYDLSAFRGARIEAVTFAFGAETAANDCTKPRATRLWITETDTTPTWLGEPDELVDLGAPGALEGCLHDYLTWDVKAAVEHAIASPDGKVTLAMRMQGVKQLLPGYGRHVRPDLRLSIKYGFAPLTPTALQVGNAACGDEPVLVAGTPDLTALVQDGTLPGGGSSDRIGGTVAVWPTADPAARVERGVFETWSGNRTGAAFVASDFADGTEYTWSMRATDWSGTSAWSEECSFTLDRVAPAAAPTVTSTDYPTNVWSGGPGIAGDFVFDGGGDPDVVRFEYTGFGIAAGSVAPDQPGGTATVSLTPTRDGPGHVEVRSVDAVGNRSPAGLHLFHVRSLPPVATCVGQPQFGVPYECVLSSALGDAVSYTYSLPGQAPVTVPADGPGATATVFLLLPSGESRMELSSTNAAGITQSSRPRFFIDNAPDVQCTGELLDVAPLDCVVTPRNMAGVTEFVWWTESLGEFENGPEHTATIGPDGVGRFQVAWDVPFNVRMNIVAVAPQGRSAAWQSDSVHVEPMPLVRNDVYPRNASGGGVGVASEFVLSRGTTGRGYQDITGFRYVLDGVEGTLPLGPDGTARLPFTPDTAGTHVIEVFSTYPEDGESMSSYYEFTVGS